MPSKEVGRLNVRLKTGELMDRIRGIRAKAPKRIQEAMDGEAEDILSVEDDDGTWPETREEEDAFGNDPFEEEEPASDPVDWGILRSKGDVNFKIGADNPNVVTFRIRYRWWHFRIWELKVHQVVEGSEVIDGKVQVTITLKPLGPITRRWVGPSWPFYRATPAEVQDGRLPRND